MFYVRMLAIQCDGLHVRYPSKQKKTVFAVTDLTFQVEQGEIVGFIGPNGAGKSSTLKALMGFVEPNAGRCTVFGAPAGSIEARKSIGYLPEVAMYYPFLSPLETLMMYGELQGLKGSKLRTEAFELLEQVGLKGAERVQNRTLSKGMMQRVGIAQSLLGNPKLLILDEVTSGLDPVGRKNLRDLLKEKHRNGTTLFFSSHELGEISALCDRILFIHKGTMVEERNLVELESSLRQFEVEFSGAVAMHDLANEISESATGFRARFTSKDSLIQAIARLQSEGATVIDIVSQEGSLEDYFVSTIEQQVAA